MQCPACHNEVGPQAIFCNHCGASLAAAAQAPIPPAPFPPQQPQAPYTPTSGYAEVPPVASSGYAEVPPAYTAPPSGYAPPPGYVPPSGYAQAPPAYPPTAPPAAGAGGLSTNSAAALAYITIIPAIIFLVVEPYNKIPLVRFHSFQSIGLAVGWFAIWMVIMVLHIILHFIPFIGFLFLLVDLVVSVGIFILWLMTILKASKGEWYKLPIIGDFAMKQAQS
jgi:uncharacterized membrane protein